jgi:enoyl-CoA hydratase/carnithine racemase
MSELIRYSIAQGVAHIVFARPDKKNAVVNEMWQRLVDVVNDAERNDSVRVVLFYGDGGNFSAGYDLADFLHRPPLAADAPIFQFLNAVTSISKPVVAAVEGVAVGIGTTLLLHCDFAYASDNARFQLPFVNLGLCPEAASSLLLPQLCGQRKAAELLLLGQPFDAQTALHCGLLNKVLTPALVLETALATAAQLAQKPPAALRISKSLLKNANRQAIADTLNSEASAFSRLLQSAEAKEAFAAFLEKRTPDFSKFK